MSKYNIIIAGEPYSIFLEILFKSIKLKKIKKPFLLICSKKLLISQMKILKFKTKINVINKNKIENIKLKKNHINILDVKFKFNKTFDKISNKSSKYITNCFNEGFILLKKKKIKNFNKWTYIKKTFFKKKIFRND